MVGLELLGQRPGRSQALGRVGLGEDDSESLVDDPGQILGQVPLDIPLLCKSCRYRHDLHNLSALGKVRERMCDGGITVGRCVLIPQRGVRGDASLSA